jgi:transcriptional regulator with XRE-family HTH domain
MGILAGISNQEVSLLERGQVTPKPTTIVKLAKGLGIGATTMQAILTASAKARDGATA